MMDGFVTTVTQKGQVTIPKELRKALKIRPKDRVAFELVNGEVRLRPVQSPVLSSFGAVKPKGKPQDYRKMRAEVEEEIAQEVSGGA
ncbi:MAG: AbrB/MazE/SpoVT family DNA-binding domain-containing protein [Chloroflexi bacterium]|nr:AbrB/MazE/SpoVT family DNA-binding domain-containing protein [Chloroflexota bacterium]